MLLFSLLSLGCFASSDDESPTGLSEAQHDRAMAATTREEREAFHLQEAQIVQGAAAVGSSSKVGIQRNKGTICAAGRYFSGNAYIGSVPIPETTSHQAVRRDMVSFLSSQTTSTFMRNHLTAGLFALVFDARDEKSKVIEGTILAQVEDDGVAIGGRKIFNFDIRADA